MYGYQSLAKELRAERNQLRRKLRKLREAGAEGAPVPEAIGLRDHTIKQLRAQLENERALCGARGEQLEAFRSRFANLEEFQRQVETLRAENLRVHLGREADDQTIRQLRAERDRWREAAKVRREDLVRLEELQKNHDARGKELERANQELQGEVAQLQASYQLNRDAVENLRTEREQARFGRRNNHVIHRFDGSCRRMFRRCTKSRLVGHDLILSKSCNKRT
jgi:chromosome segregation ATPase